MMIEPSSNCGEPAVTPNAVLFLGYLSAQLIKAGGEYYGVSDVDAAGGEVFVRSWRGHSFSVRITQVGGKR